MLDKERNAPSIAERKAVLQTETLPTIAKKAPALALADAAVGDVHGRVYLNLSQFIQADGHAFLLTQTPLDHKRVLQIAGCIIQLIKYLVSHAHGVENGRSFLLVLELYG